MSFGQLQLGPGTTPDLLAREASSERFFNGALPQRADHVGLGPQQRVRIGEVLIQSGAKFGLAHRDSGSLNAGAQRQLGHLGGAQRIDAI